MHDDGAGSRRQPCEVEQAARRSSDSPERATIFRRNGVLDYRTLVEPVLPVREVFVTQLEPGPSHVDVRLLRTENVAVVSARVFAKSTGVMILEPGYVGFGSWFGGTDCHINGERARATQIYLPGAQDGFYFRGGPRETTGVALRRKLLVDTVAALSGVDPEDIDFDLRVLDLMPPAAERFRAGLSTLVWQACGSGLKTPPAGAAEAISDAFFGLVVDAYLFARPDRPRGRTRPPEQIVRMAEEKHFSAGGSPVSLADLCVAAGTSQSALYRAFHEVCGESPLAYFRKRRLATARSMLLHSDFERGAVKFAAISAGLTELGRFSVEYRRLFGESPTATLARPEE